MFYEKQNMVSSPHESHQLLLKKYTRKVNRPEQYCIFVK
ncbi:hypothetical protein PALB_27320 [Pseudoalteromonas luteoviolacea B = ATCC 29581]|nr:hypothetical protein PALB_27320 [Pseudoalteromonas luteoviolacea B = ATCC 29581]